MCFRVPPAASEGELVSCTFERDGCTVDYQVVLSGPFNTMGRVFVGEERGEPINSPGSMIIVDVVLLVC